MCDPEIGHLAALGDLPWGAEFRVGERRFGLFARRFNGFAHAALQGRLERLPVRRGRQVARREDGQILAAKRGLKDNVALFRGHRFQSRPGSLEHVGRSDEHSRRPERHHKFISEVL